MSALGGLALGVVVFASTNLDDIFLLAAFFADPHLRPRAVVLGQLLGIGALVLLSAGAGLAALAVPAWAVALLGLAPLGLGLARLRELVRARAAPEEDAAADERSAEARTGSQVLAVAAVTVANGGDNLGVYIPLFADEPGLVPAWAALFAALTLLWCRLAWRLVHGRWTGAGLRRAGRVALPFVLIALGLHVLWPLVGGASP